LLPFSSSRSTHTPATTGITQPVVLRFLTTITKSDVQIAVEQNGPPASELVEKAATEHRDAAQEAAWQSKVRGPAFTHLVFHPLGRVAAVCLHLFTTPDTILTIDVPLAVHSGRCCCVHRQLSALSGCVYIGHTNTDMDSVGSAIACAELYGGTASRATRKVNNEIKTCLECVSLCRHCHRHHHRH
jgi:hypothetical protein